jgi:outer membrane protein TolC
MTHFSRHGNALRWSVRVLGLFLVGLCPAAAQEQSPAPRILHPTTALAPVAYTPPAAADWDRPLPINLPTALRLANANPLDIGIAAERISTAAAQLGQANVKWLPNILMGTDYYRHDGQVQTVQGPIIGNSKSSVMVGGAPYAVFALTDAIFLPLAARQTLRAREAALQATTNDTLLTVAESYFNVQQARGELAGALETVRRGEELARLAGELSKGLVPPVEAVRARTEVARRRQAVQGARERWRTSSAELARILRLGPAALLEPMEPPHLRVTLVGVDGPVDDLIPIALTHRPELAGQQALVQATLQRLRQEKMRPFLPSILLRGASTNPAGTLAGGFYGGGVNSSLGNFSARSDWDLQVLWELQSLGLGNRARIKEMATEKRVAEMQFLRTRDYIAAEVVQAYAQVRSAATRSAEAEVELKDAVDSLDKNFEGLGQTKRAGDAIILVIRPQEVVAALQALALAYGDYYGAVADYDRAQFRLYRALGRPAHLLAAAATPAEPTPYRPAFGAPVPHKD